MGKRSPQRAQTLHTLQVVTTKMTLLGKGTKRRRVVHAIVLYQQGLRMPIAISRGARGLATSRAGRCRHVLLCAWRPCRTVPRSRPSWRSHPSRSR